MSLTSELNGWGVNVSFSSMVVHLSNLAVDLGVQSEPLVEEPPLQPPLLAHFLTLLTRQ